jgi:hypothetical protein
MVDAPFGGAAARFCYARLREFSDSEGRHARRFITTKFSGTADESRTIALPGAARASARVDHFDVRQPRGSQTRRSPRGKKPIWSNS